MKNKRGISLIVLVITIIIIIILAATVILSLSNNNPIENAEKARILSDIDTFRAEFTLSLGKKYADNHGVFDTSKITDKEIEEYIPSIKDKEVDGVPYKDIITIAGGEFGVKDNDELPEETKQIIVGIVGGITGGTSADDDSNPEDDIPTEDEPQIPEVKNTYTITYDLNGGRGTFDIQTKNEGESIVLNSEQPTKAGYTFDGWKAQDGSVYEASAIYEQDEDTMLTAQWKTVTYTITYNLGGGSSTNKTTYTIETETFSLTMPTRTNYAFTGWSGTDLYETTKSVTVLQGSIGDRTYTANWAVALASINNINYASIQDAIDSITSTAQTTIKLKKSQQLSYDDQNEDKIYNDKNIILDLNTYTLTLNEIVSSGYNLIENNNKMTIKNGTIKAENVANSQYVSHIILNNASGTVTLDSTLTINTDFGIMNYGDFVSNAKSITFTPVNTLEELFYVVEGGSLVINGGTITSKGGNVISNFGETDIKGGSLDGRNCTDSTVFNRGNLAVSAVSSTPYIYGNGTSPTMWNQYDTLFSSLTGITTINAGYIYGYGCNAILNQGGTVNIKGGTITGTANNYPVVFNRDNFKTAYIYMTGGTVSNTAGGYALYNESGTISKTGGTASPNKL